MLVVAVVSESRGVVAKLLETVRQFGQVRHESTMQPTAASSPSLNFFTSRPDLDDAADDFVTGHAGVGRVPPHSLRAVCKSEWQTPQKRISICTSVAVGGRRSIAKGASGDVAALAA